ncbi:SDR family oxidoreductase [Microcella sp.]|uniref:SDR family oxidoreductase n=1 Tax=Microcella sp. TaxID=1913979 RepID=UPI003918A904
MDADVDTAEKLTGAVLITGVGRRGAIGHTTARLLAERGRDIAFTYWSPYERRAGLPWESNGVDTIRAELEAFGVRVLPIEVDFTDAEAVEAIVVTAAAALGPVSGLVLAHSESIDSSILTTTLESFDRHFAVNVRAAWQLIAAVARQVPEGEGRIVAFTSDHVVDNMPYGASKGALDRIVIAAARELGHLGLTANLINPGPVDTGWMTDEVRAHLTAMQPTGRLGTPDDAARLVDFLLSPAGRWISGQLLTSDGGFSV